jgi:hypothetical protein
MAAAARLHPARSNRRVVRLLRLAVSTCCQYFFPSTLCLFLLTFNCRPFSPDPQVVGHLLEFPAVGTGARNLAQRAPEHQPGRAFSVARSVCLHWAPGSSARCTAVQLQEGPVGAPGLRAAATSA